MVCVPRSVTKFRLQGSRAKVSNFQKQMLKFATYAILGVSFVFDSPENCQYLCLSIFIFTELYIESHSNIQTISL